MAAYVFVLGIVALAIALAFGRPAIAEHHRKRLRTKPFPHKWDRILEERLPIYRRLPHALKIQLQGHIQVFLAEKAFYGCGGLELTDEIRVTIAGSACLLILNRKSDDFPGLYSILVYPSEFIVKGARQDEAGVVTEEERILSGESWSQGKVILSWDNITHDFISVSSGDNVVLHEFAHQLDQQSGYANGAPILDRRGSYSRWAAVFTREFEELREQAADGETSVISGYGATHPAEFFATATEAFFEKPEQLKRDHSALYEELRKYYQVDPAEWL